VTLPALKRRDLKKGWAYFIKVMRDTKNKLSRKDVVAKMCTLMQGKFAQNPQLEGNATNRAQAIVY
jgi:hypothetical protein